MLYHIYIFDNFERFHLIYFIAVDFFNELSLIWGIICDIGFLKIEPGKGFPPGFEYRWSDGSSLKSPVYCSGPEYVEFVMNWVDKEINNGVLFPTSSCK